jgi:8-amino-7-oxononanoate synthase
MRAVEERAGQVRPLHEPAPPHPGVGAGHDRPRRATAWESALEDRLAELERNDLLRELRPVERPVDPLVFRDGSPLLNLSSNNYLGLAGHPAIAEAMARACARGAGATASRLVTGTDRACLELEEKLAAFKGTEEALVFGSGYLANVGVLSALLDRDDAVFSDRLNHASIWDGIQASRATLYRYRHADVEHLERQLEQADRKGARRKLIVTETVFSMDGDVAPLAALADVAERFGAALVVDDAHGGAVFGPRGEGYAHEAGVADHIDLQIGTFSKGFGVYGAYAAGSRTWIRYLVNACRGFVYTTALPPAVIAGIDAAVDLVAGADGSRRSLLEKADRFRSRLVELGFDVCGSTTQIVPAVLGASSDTVAFARELEQRGVLAVPIRPPTVPARSARVRFSLSAAHADDELERALAAVKEVNLIRGCVRRS